MKVKIVVCSGKHCRKRGSKDVCRVMEKYCDAYDLDKVKVKQKDCLGLCGRGPAMKVKPLGISFTRVEPGDCKEIARALMKGGKRPLERLRNSPAD